MKRLFIAAFCYLVVGLASGVYYREITKINDFSGETQLSVLHTHLLTLGVIVLLIALALERVFNVSHSQKLNTWFFWLYNGGLIVTVAMMTINGTFRVFGTTTGAAVSGIAGLGHILMSAGLIVYFVALGRSLKRVEAEAA
ncbi:DUF2871 domain-containing protein [Lysinibacter cavernae]|uniref:Cbb3-type cytochrome oxidase subunit 1 n=1 Tax=Lysinibacter cavernae TaxID=1640652 RepID=A0A7X5R2T7_9MICO|nr:DUF2871 domain-containing protein [Lysinibacter cavernae]NIH54628.1 cbb3-type cytochrome oxidase subunit 1 [Lysinibacter cavernae]